MRKNGIHISKDNYLNKKQGGALSKYFIEVNSIDEFNSREEEYACAVKAFEGDEIAQGILVKKNLRFVIAAAKQYASDEETVLELISEGNYGLIEASKRFDPSRKTKFISYAVWYIKRRILEYYYNNGMSIGVPGHRILKLSKFRKELSTLEQKLGRSVTFDDIAYEFHGRSEAEIRNLWEAHQLGESSLDLPASQDDDTLTIADLVRAEVVDPIEQLDADVRANSINYHLDKLNRTDKFIIEHRFGLNGNTKKSELRDIAIMLDCTVESVRQRLNKNLRMLRYKLKSNELKYMT